MSTSNASGATSSHSAITARAGGETYLKQRSHVLSFRLARQTNQNLSTLMVAWDPLLHESLLEGHFQFLPAPLLRLRSGVPMRLWTEVLIRRPTASLREPGRWVEYSLTGPPPLPHLAGAPRPFPETDG